MDYPFNIHYLLPKISKVSIIMRAIKNKFIGIITLLAVLSVVFGPLWISQAEANLGIQICTAEGIKTIPAPDALPDKSAPQKQSHETLSPCFICTQNDQDDSALILKHPTLAIAFQKDAPFTLAHNLQAKDKTFLTPISARAPPYILL